MRDFLFFALVLCFVALWTRLTLRSIAQQPLLSQKNYLGEEVTGSAGLAFVGSSCLGWLLICWKGLVDWHEGGQMMVAAFWFGTLGLLDDIAADSSVRGWRGHLKAFLREKKVTTGFVKLVGGGIGALSLSAWVVAAGAVENKPMSTTKWLLPLVLGALLIALGANTLNLLDVRPSRALKGFWGLSTVGLIVSQGNGWQALVPLLAGTFAYAPADFSRKAMMGDAGSNPLGACFGVWVLNHWAQPSKFWSVELWALLLLFVTAQIYAERRSITEDVKKVPLLRWLDELGVKK